MPNPYSTGTNVYRGGSSAATMGQVNPMGYVNRELGNRRSQLAQGMLQKLRGQTQSQGRSSNVQIDPSHVSLLAVRMLGGGGGQ